MEAALAALRRVFGYEGFRSPQESIIEALLQGRDCFVLMPTGAGKSICYQIPALVQAGTAIIVSPLISLMKDQVDALRQNGVRAAFYNSTLSDAEGKRVLESLNASELDLLYVAPERLMTPDFQRRLAQIPLAFVAIDEAHCVSQWGHDFRPEYVKLGSLRAQLSNVPFIALTATADKQTREDILLRLQLKDPAIFISGFDRPNIRYTVVEKSNPMQQLETFVGGRRDESGIVYCLSRKRVEQVAEHLRGKGFSAAPYHAGLASAERGRVQEQFQKDDVQIVVATVAFGMGIDKPNVRYVVHYDLPKNIESYYQETGRAGRDGIASDALLLYGSGDIVTVRQLIQSGENPAQNQIELKKLASMVEFAESMTCRRRMLLGYFGELTDSDCGNCDICLDSPVQYDATEDAKLALMTVYRLQQRFGVQYVVEVLRGAQTARIAQLGHDRLEFYGKGKYRPAEDWMSILRQLVQQGLLTQDADNYNVLKLTPATRPVLREGASLWLATPRVKVEKTKSRSKGRVEKGNEEYDVELFEKLRVLRRKIAEEDGVPPYLVFGDVTLRHMSVVKPQSEEALLGVSGVGDRKLQRYGSRFLEVIVGG